MLMLEVLTTVDQMVSRSQLVDDTSANSLSEMG